MRKTIKISIILVLILISSCKEQTENSKIPITVQTETTQEEKYFFDCKTELINGIEFEACIKRPGTFTIKSSKGKVVYNDDNPFDFEFYDFNGDGYSDIRMNYVSNTPGLQGLLLFDIKSNEFKKVKTFYKYPNSRKIKNSDFYYSYHGSGCADNDWGSELFKIEGTQITELGKIQGFGCLENETNGIYIYKVIGAEKELIKHIKREQGYWKEKWGFIEKYWTENKAEFE